MLPSPDKSLSPNSCSIQFPQFYYSMDEVTSLLILPVSLFDPASSVGRAGEQWFPPHCLCRLSLYTCLSQLLLSSPRLRHHDLSHHLTDRTCFIAFAFPLTPSSWSTWQTGTAQKYSSSISVILLYRCATIFSFLFSAPLLIISSICFDYWNFE